MRAEEAGMHLQDSWSPSFATRPAVMPVPALLRFPFFAGPGGRTPLVVIYDIRRRPALPHPTPRR
jgi:hypothetical protein